MGFVLMGGARLACWMDQPHVQHVLLLLILANAAILGLENYASIESRWGQSLRLADQTLLCIFAAEIAARIVGHGRNFPRGP